MARLEKMESALHLPPWMLGQCKLLKELLARFGEELVAKDMEGVEACAGNDTPDFDIVITEPEDGGGPLGQVCMRGLGQDCPESA